MFGQVTGSLCNGVYNIRKIPSLQINLDQVQLSNFDICFFDMSVEIYVLFGYHSE